MSEAKARLKVAFPFICYVVAMPCLIIGVVNYWRHSDYFMLAVLLVLGPLFTRVTYQYWRSIREQK